MDKIYVPGNKDWHNYQQNRKLFITFLVVDIIIIIASAIVGIFVYNKINTIKNYDNTPETEYGIYEQAISDITGNDDIKINSQDDIDKLNKDIDEKMQNETYIMPDENYADNLVENLPGPMIDRATDELEEITNMEIKDLKDQLTATLYADTLYYYTKIKAHDYYYENKIETDMPDDWTCESAGFNENQIEECQAYAESHFYFKDESIIDDDYFSQSEGASLYVALDGADKPLETNLMTGRSYSDSTKDIAGWLFATAFNSEFKTGYHIRYNKILNKYLTSKLWNNGGFKNISKQVIIQGKNENYDGYKCSLYMIFQMKGKTYKAAFYSGSSTYKLLDIEYV